MKKTIITNNLMTWVDLNMDEHLRLLKNMSKYNIPDDIELININFRDLCNLYKDTYYASFSLPKTHQLKPLEEIININDQESLSPSVNNNQDTLETYIDTYRTKINRYIDYCRNLRNSYNTKHAIILELFDYIQRLTVNLNELFTFKQKIIKIRDNNFRTIKNFIDANYDEAGIIQKQTKLDAIHNSNNNKITRNRATMNRLNATLEFLNRNRAIRARIGGDEHPGDVGGEAGGFSNGGGTVDNQQDQLTARLEALRRGNGLVRHKVNSGDDLSNQPVPGGRDVSEINAGSGNVGNNRSVGNGGNNESVGNGGNNGSVRNGENNRGVGNGGNNRGVGNGGNNRGVGNGENNRGVGNVGNNRSVGNDGNNGDVGNVGNNRSVGNDGNNGDVEMVEIMEVLKWWK